MTLDAAARRLAPRHGPLDADDLAQEGALAALLGRDPRWGMVDAVRRWCGRFARPAQQDVVELDVALADHADPTRPAELRDQAAVLLRRAGPRGALVLWRRACGRSLREVGRELGVSESRACQLERAASERVLRGGVG